MVDSSARESQARNLLDLLDQAEPLWLRLNDKVLFERNVVIAETSPATEFWPSIDTPPEPVSLTFSPTDLVDAFDELRKHFGAESVPGPPGFLWIGSVFEFISEGFSETARQPVSLPDGRLLLLDDFLSCDGNLQRSMREATERLRRMQELKIDWAAHYMEPARLWCDLIQNEFTVLRRRLRDELAPKVVDDFQNVPPEYRDGECREGEPLTAEYVGKAEKFNLSGSQLTKHFGEGMKLTDRIKVGRKYIYRFKEIAAFSSKKIFEEDRRENL